MFFSKHIHTSGVHLASTAQGLFGPSERKIRGRKIVLNAKQIRPDAPRRRIIESLASCTVNASSSLSASDKPFPSTLIAMPRI